MQAYTKGFLTSSTLLVTTDFLESTVKSVVKTTEIPIGLHLSLTLGKCCAPAEDIPLLVDKHGFFCHSPLSLFRRLMVSKKVEAWLKEIEKELIAQLKKICDFNITITHIDSHQHIHMIPSVFKILQRITPHFGISRIRFPFEPFNSCMFYTQPFTVIKRKNLLKWLLMRINAFCINNNFRSPDFFWGTLSSGILNKRIFLKLIKEIKPDHSYELGIHPGFPAKQENVYPQKNYNKFISSTRRKEEFDLLLDEELFHLLNERSVKLISYMDI